MKYILDTDTIIYFLKGNKSVIERIGAVSKEDITTTIINHSELVFGAYNSARKAENLKIINSFITKFDILPFCLEASEIFGELKAFLKQHGSIVADLDLMIASITIKQKRTLITNNGKHFSKIKGLKIENWCSIE